MSDPEFAIVLNGTYGVGKTAVLEHLGDQLVARDRPFALLDVDWFHRSWPLAPWDPANQLVEAANLRDVWRRYRSVGPRQAVLSGVLANRAAVQRYADALDLDLRVFLLVADPATLRTRLRSRYTEAHDHHFRWHADRTEDLQITLRASDVDQTVVDTGTRSAADVAAAILRHCDLGEPSDAT